MPADARDLLSIHALHKCLECRFETENLDFKEAMDISSRRGVVELAKDVMAMANTVGGYVVVGVENSTFRLVGISDEAADTFREGKSVNDKLRCILQDQVTVQSAVHQVQDGDGKTKNIALICIYPRPNQLPAPTDGDYDRVVNDKRTERKCVFQQGTIFLRKGDESTRAKTEDDYVRRPYSMEDFLVFHDPKQEKSLIDFLNPYDFSIAARSEMFKGREDEISQMLMSAENGAHMSVFGLQRIGKTSLVEEAFTERIRQKPALKDAVFATLNLQELGSGDITYKQFLDEIILTIALAASEKDDGQGVQAAIEQFLAAPHRYRIGDKKEIFKDYERIIETVAERSPRQIVLFLDEFSELCRAMEKNCRLTNSKTSRNETLRANEMLVDIPLIHLFGSMLKSRRLKRKLTVIFSIRPFVSQFDSERDMQLLKIANPIEINHLDELAAKRLINDPIRGVIAIDGAATDYLYRLTAGHPYLIQFMMQALVDGAKIKDRPTIRLEEVKNLEQELISNGAKYEPQFKVLDSDYSVDEVINPKIAELGRGTLALISKIGTVRKEGWVEEDEIKDELAKYKIGEGAAADILKKFESAKIIQTANFNDKHCLRVCIPLLRKRYVAQDMYQRYFRDVFK